jgi:transcriptional regulator with XRE-family HTH domain
VTDPSDRAFRLAFGARLRALREAAGLTPAALATAAGVRVRTYELWEQGRHAPVSMRTAVLLADVLVCSMDALLGRGGGPGLSPAPARACQPRRRRRALRRE